MGSTSSSAAAGRPSASNSAARRTACSAQPDVDLNAGRKLVAVRRGADDALIAAADRGKHAAHAVYDTTQRDLPRRREFVRPDHRCEPVCRHGLRRKRECDERYAGATAAECLAADDGVADSLTDTWPTTSMRTRNSVGGTRRPRITGGCYAQALDCSAKERVRATHGSPDVDEFQQYKRPQDIALMATAACLLAGCNKSSSAATGGGGSTGGTAAAAAGRRWFRAGWCGSRDRRRHRQGWPARRSRSCAQQSNRPTSRP